MVCDHTATACTLLDIIAIANTLSMIILWVLILTAERNRIQ